jgi:predicted transcriptional regulator
MTGDDLRERRDRLGLTQDRLARLCDMTQPEISRAERRGPAPLRKGTVARLELGLAKAGPPRAPGGEP